MAQVTVDIEDELEARVRAAAETANLSHSRWLADLIRERLADRWPDDVAALAGAWREFPEDAALRAGLGEDLPRERF